MSGIFVDGFYPDTPMVGGSGIDATADITVVNSVVTICTIKNPGMGYQINDKLTANIPKLEIVLTLAPGSGWSFA